eukprot:57025-Prymnesium_polylepis.2
MTVWALLSHGAAVERSAAAVVPQQRHNKGAREGRIHLRPADDPREPRSHAPAMGAGRVYRRLVGRWRSEG